MAEQKVAIVTAAGQGIGAACARELAARGYRLALMARSPEIVPQAQALNGLGLAGSVTDEADLRALVSETMQAYGRIDAVVNNTGHPAKGDLLAITDTDWHSGLDLLLLNVVRMARLVTPIFMQQDTGVIVNVSSLFAVEPSLGYPVSSSLRAALTNFTKLYADKYAESGIRMNNILPGFVENYNISDEVQQTIPMKRTGQLAEIARTVAFLLSADAGYITGQNIVVDGGLARSG